MTQRDASGSRGGMTGATGDLTPDEVPDDLIPAERREIEHSANQPGVTQAQAGSPPGDEDDPSAHPVVSDEPAPQSEPQAGVDDVSNEEERF